MVKTGEAGSGRRVGALVTALVVVMGVLLGQPVAAEAAGVEGGSPTAGAVWGWGGSDHGQLGTGEILSPTDARPPAAVPGMADVVDLAAGDGHSLALTAGGLVWAWGRGAEGQLGDGAKVRRARPVRVSGLVDVVGIAASGEHSLAVHRDGTVSAWGTSPATLVSEGVSLAHATPVKVSGLTGIVQVAAAGSATLAVAADGGVWELGYFRADTGAPLPPQRVHGLGEVRAVAVSPTHRLAVLRDGTVKAWGTNGSGQLGDGTTTGRGSPLPVTGLTGVVDVAAGWAHSVALLADGTLRAWGDNSRGQLGVAGAPAYATTPIPVTGVTRATAITAAERHTLAAVTGGVVGWGDNAAGQLGSPPGTVRAVPGPVFGLTDVRALTTGSHHSLATRSSSPTAPGTPAHVQASASSGKATVTWTAVPDGGSPITGWVITSSPGGVVVEAAPEATSAEVSGLVDGRSHRFTVAARNAVGVGAASAPSEAVVHPVAPSAPLGVTATHGCPFGCDAPWQPGGPTVTVGWLPPAHTGGSPVTGYRVTLATVAATRTVDLGNVTTYQATGLTYGEALTVTVAARNAAGTGPTSQPAHITPVAVPAVPRDVTATAGVGAATVTWTAPISDGGTPITAYIVAGSDGSTTTVSGSARSTTVTGLAAGQPLTFRVRARNAAGLSAPSTATAMVTPRPAPVTSLSVTPGAADAAGTPRLTASLAWTTPAGADAIRILWSDGTAAKAVTLSSASSSHTLTGLTAGRAYTVEVSALAGGVASSSAKAVLGGSVLTATPSASTVTSGASVTLRGTLRSPSGAALAGQPVQLQASTQRADGTWSGWTKSGAAVLTSSTGAYARSTTPTRTTRYRMVFGGSASVIGATSPARTVTVAPAISAALSATTVKPGAKVVLSGTVKPNLAGRTVFLQRRSGDSWTTVASTRLTSTSSYRFSITAVRGSTTYRVRIAAATPYVQGLSPARTLTGR